MSDKIQGRFWSRQMDDVMSEIARQSAICQVKLLDPGVIEAVVHNNSSVCGNSNPKAFKKLRELMMMGLVMREKSVEKLGPVETEAMVTAIRDRLKERLGGRLGGSA